MRIRVLISALVAAPLLWAGVDGPDGVDDAKPISAREELYLSFDDRFSHNGLYRAQIDPGKEPVRLDDSPEWILIVRTPEGAPVTGAVIDLKAWTPRDGRPQRGLHPTAHHLERGRYSIQGLRLDRNGWWTISVNIAGPAGVDSLGFNLIAGGEL